MSRNIFRPWCICVLSSISKVDAFKLNFFNVASKLDHFLKLILQRPENQLEGCQLFDTWHVAVAIYDSYLEFTYRTNCNGLVITKVLPIYRGFLRNNLRHYCCFEIERLKSITSDSYIKIKNEYSRDGTVLVLTYGRVSIEIRTLRNLRNQIQLALAYLKKVPRYIIRLLHSRQLIQLSLAKFNAVKSLLPSFLVYHNNLLAQVKLYNEYNRDSYDLFTGISTFLHLCYDYYFIIYYMSVFCFEESALPLDISSEFFFSTFLVMIDESDSRISQSAW